MARVSNAVLLSLATACARPAPSPSAEPIPPPPVNPYGDLLAHEVMRDAQSAEIDEDARREEGMRALDEGRYEEAREIFAELLEREDDHDDALARLHRQAEALAATASEAHSWRVGVAECDEYVEHWLSCVDKLPDATREATREAIEQTVAAWREVAQGPGRDTLRQACETAREMAQKATESLGCEW